MKFKPNNNTKFKSLYISVLTAFLFCCNLSIAQTDNISGNSSTPEFISQDSPWADSIIGTMNLDEKIGQLFMVAAYSNKDENHLAELSTLVEEQHIGGVIFFKGSPLKQAKMTNYLQHKSEVPLFVAIDGEWGLAMRLDSTIKYPRQMLLGAIQDEVLIEEMGSQIGKQCNAMGIHINFAPVIDVNNNPKNPVINNRSFGEVKENVGNLGVAYMVGMQKHKVLACGKHFPGHGDTDKDSHKSLPIIPHDYDRLDSLELYPFKQLINEGLASMMVAHLYIPELDNTENQASTLSPKIVDGLLKDSLGFEGLIFTDALNMKGVSSYYEPGEVDVKALLAGNDVLLFPLDVPNAISAIKEALAKGEITEEEITQRCHKILKAKEWAGLANQKDVNTATLHAEINQPEYEALNHKLAKNAITLLKNNDVLPLKTGQLEKTVYLNIGTTKKNQFEETMRLYADFDQINIARSLSSKDEEALIKSCTEYDRIIIGFHRTTNNPRTNFGITRQSIAIHNLLSTDKEVITVVFGNPYALEAFGAFENTEALIVGYEDSPFTQRAAAQAIFGGINPKGKLPVTASEYYMAGDGLNYEKKTRLSYVLPEEIGIDSKDLIRIDEIAKNGIRKKAFPGCQIVAIKDGNVFYNKSFGHHTYEKEREVKGSDLYDLASITKIAATTITLIHLQKEGVIDINNSLTKYIPEFVDSTPYQNMIIREMLAHQAGLHSWIPFYYSSLKDGNPDPSIYATSQDNTHSDIVANNLYIHKDYDTVLINRIVREPLRRKRYKYSDLGYYFLKYIIEKETDTKLEYLVDSIFYKPMGLRTMTYHPLKKFDKEMITPTENDTIYRKQLVWGHVHDPGAAMQGGVGSHAGLFSNAMDLATLMYMLINNGEYGGEQVLDPETIDMFTGCQYCPRNRRGAGFDKPLRSLDGGPTCGKVSLSSFGHSGFTGTITWADPEKGIVYVFLSNRVYPNAENWLILKENIRTDIQEVIYTAAGY